MSNNRQCMCCDNIYYYCPSCGRDRLKPTWYATFCSETCKDLWQTSSRYSMEFITKEDAVQIINTLDLQDVTVYRPRIQKFITDITHVENKIEPEKKFKRGKRIEIKPIDEFADIEPVIEIEQPTEVAEQAHEVVFEKE